VPDPDGPPLPKVVILGGGVAGMTTAFELTGEGWRDRFESVTVYQYGWRLGGKGASGRGVHGRIEEHGLHIWLGFYENAFRMLRECYEELGRDPATCPITTIEAAFERASTFIVQEPRGDSWLPWTAQFSETDEMPGTSDKEYPSLWGLMVEGLRLLLTFNTDAQLETPELLDAPPVVLTPDDPPPASPVVLAPVPKTQLRELSGALRDLYLKIWYLVADLHVAGLAAAIALAESLPADPAEHDASHHRLLMHFIDREVDRLHHLATHSDEQSDQERREWYLTDILLAVIRGLLADGVLFHPDGLDSIDHWDFAEWLIRHGATAESARCGLVTTLMYDLAFAYHRGDPHAPSVGAGTAVRGATRLLFTYTGAMAWKMRAGMGDVVFAPMFEVLEARGVRFEFFHRVESLHPSDDGQRVASIELSRQATIKDPAAGYRPLVDVKGLPCWPNAPRNEQLVNPLTPQDAESFWSTAQPEGRLTLHDGTDYDAVVLAIPVGAHPYVCPELLERAPQWQAMVDKVETVYTQAFQLWLGVDMAGLGCDWPPSVTGGYLEPFDTWADMRQLIDREDWAAGTVGAIAYFCNTMPTPAGLPSRDDHDLPTRAADQVKANALAFLGEAMAPLWPRAVRRYPTEFRWEYLVDEENREGPARFDGQFWRANVDPSERYVLSVPGSSRYRLAADDSGYDNLVFAGDWTRCNLNAGCVEAAVISGLLAAAAVDAERPPRSIIGVTHGAQGARHAS
jgi:uncharacterized protein with NAD-binding domain and iron-sulfur cluster